MRNKAETTGIEVITSMGMAAVLVYEDTSSLHPGQNYVEYANGDRGWARIIVRL